MITKTIQLYTIDELAPAVRDKVLAKFRVDDECEYLPDDLRYKAEELIKEAGIKGDLGRIYYSLSWSQGDGVMFEGSFEWEGYSVVIRHSGRYYHEYSKTFEWVGDVEPTEAKEREFDLIYVRICGELTRYGYDVIDTAQSDENLIDMIKANDYYFTDKGVLESQ